MKSFLNPFGNFRLFRQLERSDCGLACVQMLSYHFGKKVSLKQLRVLTETNRHGISLNDLKDLFNRLDMDCENVLLATNEVYKIPCPAILYWDQCHFVVLYHIDKKKKIFHIADPSEGKVKFNEKDLLNHWSQDSGAGIVTLAEPGEKFSTQSLGSFGNTKPLLRLIKDTFVSNKSAFAKLLAFTLICMGADLAMPLLTQNTVDTGIQSKDVRLVWLIALFQLMVLLGNTLSVNFISYCNAKLGMALNLQMTKSYLKKLLGAPLSFFDTKVSGDLIQKIDDQNRVKEYLMRCPTSILTIFFNLTVFMGIMVWYNTMLLGVFLFVTLLEILWNLMFLRSRKGLDYQYFRHSAKNRNMIYETVNGIKEIKVGGGADNVMGRWEELQHNLIAVGMKSTALNMWNSGGLSMLGSFKQICITALCATLVIGNKLSFGEMLAVGYVIGRLSAPFSTIMGLVWQTQDVKISYDRLEEVLTQPVAQAATGQSLPAEMAFSDVWFRYPGKSSPFVISELNLEIKPGETIAIVGASGCGKTTLLKLVLGFYTPQKGSIELGGSGIDTLNREDWVAQCGVVMQDGYIFSESITDNIALSKTGKDLELVKEVAGIVGLDSFIETLPLGYHTGIGPSGMELSGGQKQRLLIARALYKRPSVLVLDEATSSLDATNEAQITKRIMQYQKGKTTIIAAHRLSTVRHADRILVMDCGRIVEQGTHSELINAQGAYYRLVSSQLEYTETV